MITIKGMRTPFLALAILVVAVAPLVYGHFFNGFNTPWLVRNYDNNTIYSGFLRAYGDTNDSLCNDSDNGIKPDINGTVTWFDPFDGNYYTRKDYCINAGSVLEIGCVKNFSVNGQPLSNIVAGVRVDCNANGFTSCNPVLRRCV